MEITKREIMVSIIIFFLLLGLGFLFHNLIIENYILEIEKYNKALKIDNDVKLFKYSVDTEVGNILVYGKFNIESGMTFSELKNDYIYIKKETEEYQRHSKQVCNTDSNGNRHCHTEYYYSWDIINTESKNVNDIFFLENKYAYSLFNNYPEYRLDIDSNVMDDKKDYVRNNYLYKDKQGFFGASVGDIRYSYYYTPKEFMGTIFAKAKNKTILNVSESGSITINNSDLNTTIENKKNQQTIINVVFWLIWIIITGLIIYGYMYLENDYLED